MFNDSLGNFGFKDINDNIIVKPKYRYESMDYSQKRVLVYVGGKSEKKYTSYGGYDYYIKGAKWGYVSLETGQEVIPVKYDEIVSREAYGKLIKVKLNNKWGYVDSSGNEVIAIKYDSIRAFSGYEKVILNEFVLSSKQFSKGFAAVMLNNKWGYINSHGKEIIPPMFDGAMNYTEGLGVIHSDSKWGYADTTGKIAIPMIYDYCESFYEGLGVVRKNNKWGFIDKTGKEIIPLKYDNVKNICSGLARVELNGKWGFIDLKGKEIIPLQYDDAEIFWKYNDVLLAKVWKNGKCGFIDIAGKIITPIKYDEINNPNYAINGEINPYFLNYRLVKMNNKYGFLNEDGKEMVPAKYDEIVYNDFSEPYRKAKPYLMVKLNDKYGYINPLGKEIIVPKYDLLGQLNDNNVIEVRVGEKLGLIDTTGKEIIPVIYDKIEMVRNNLIKVGLLDAAFNSKKHYQDENRYKWGYWNKAAGKETIPVIYDDLGEFSEGLVAALYNGKWGFIDAMGKERIPFQYAAVASFSEGFAAVSDSLGEWSFINKKGKVITPRKYSTAAPFADGRAKVCLDTVCGFIDTTGKEVIKLKYSRYDYSKDFFGGYAQVILNGKYGYIDRTGKETVPIKYDQIVEYYDSTYNEGYHLHTNSVRCDNKELSSFNPDNSYTYTTDRNSSVRGHNEERFEKDRKTFSKLLLVMLDGKFGFLNKEGKVIVPVKYDCIRHLGNYTEVCLNNKWGIVDNATGKEIIPLMYDEINADSCFSQAAVLKTIKVGMLNKPLSKLYRENKYDWGYVDTKNHLTIPVKYSEIYCFQEGLASASVNFKWGFVDTAGNEIIPIKYDYGGYFSEGLAIVCLNKKWGVVDRNNKVIVEFKYEQINHWVNGLAIVKRGEKHGCIDRTGKEIIPAIYDELQSFIDGKAEAYNYKEGVRFYINEKGERLENIKK